MSIRTQDKRAVLVHNFIVGHEYEVVVQAIGPDGTQQAMENAARGVIKIIGKQDSPDIPTSLVATGFFEAITLTWANPLDFDFYKMEIYRSDTDDILTSAKLADAFGVTYIDVINTTGTTKYYWIRAVNRSGFVSDFTESVNATTLGVTATDIDDFAVTVTKQFTNTVVLSGEIWSNNLPSAGRIQWNTHTLVHQGKAYQVTAGGGTTARYITWTVGNTGGSGTVADPYITTYSSDATWSAADDKFNIVVNEGGLHQVVWNSSANMVIGSAFILDAAIVTAKINDLAVTNAKIATMTATKLTAGTIDASVITVTNLNATNITTGILTGRTVQTAASGQRVVIDGSASTLSFFRSAGGAVVVIDDDITNGFVSINVATNYYTRMFGDSFQMRSDQVSGFNQFALTMNASNPGNFVIFSSGATAKFTVSTAGSITLSGTVDGVDLAAFKTAYDAHILDDNAHHAEVHDLDSHSDVNITTVGDADTLRYDGGFAEWQNV